MAEVTEAMLYERLGLKAPEPVEPDEGEKEQEVAEPAEESQGPEAEEEESPKTEEPQEQSQAERRENAARRRRAEQQEAIDKAVKEAREDERAKARADAEAREKNLFSAAGLKNPFTGEPIETIEQFERWNAQYRRKKIEQDLGDGNVTRETIDAAIADNDTIRAAQEIIKRDAEERERRERAEFDARAERELAEIRKLDPSVQTLEDALKLPTGERFRELVGRGNSFIDAFYLANREQIEARRAETARQQAAINARGKDHLTKTAPRGAGAPTIPAEEMKLFRQLMPDATREEIEKYYAKQKGESKGGS